MSKQNIGTVIQVTGPVLDIRFADGQLPDLLNAIEIDNQGKKAGGRGGPADWRQCGPLHCYEQHRRPGARRAGRGYRQPHHRARGRGLPWPRVQPAG